MVFNRNRLCLKRASINPWGFVGPFGIDQPTERPCSGPDRSIGVRRHHYFVSFCPRGVRKNVGFRSTRFWRRSDERTVRTTKRPAECGSFSDLFYSYYFDDKPPTTDKDDISDPKNCPESSCLNHGFTDRSPFLGTKCAKRLNIDGGVCAVRR